MGGPTVRNRGEAVSPLVRVYDFQLRRFANDAVALAGNHLAIQLRPLGDLCRSAVADFFIRRAGDVNRLLEFSMTIKAPLFRGAFF